LFGDGKGNPVSFSDSDFITRSKEDHAEYCANVEVTAFKKARFENVRYFI